MNQTPHARSWITKARIPRTSEVVAGPFDGCVFRSMGSPPSPFPRSSLVQSGPCLPGTEGGYQLIPFAVRTQVVWAIAELLIDCEEDRTLRAVLVGMLREDERR
jgi:hypothetical protein